MLMAWRSSGRRHKYDWDKEKTPISHLYFSLSIYFKKSKHEKTIKYWEKQKAKLEKGFWIQRKNHKHVWYLEAYQFRYKFCLEI